MYKITWCQKKWYTLDNYLRSEQDPLTKTALRYNGFWNDVGEALKSFLPRSLYIGSYFVTSLYALGSVYYTNRRLRDQKVAPNQVAAQTVDQFVWQLFATVAITPVIIMGIKRGTQHLLTHPGLSNILTASIKTKFIPSIVGVLAIPLIVPPVDNGVTFCMNYFRTIQQPYHWSGLYRSLHPKQHS